MPPEDEEAGPEDEEGRFFGGGITSNTANVLDFMDEQANDETVGFKKQSVKSATMLIQPPEIREN